VTDDDGDVRSELIDILSEELNEGGIENTVVQPTWVDGGVQSPAQLLVPFSTDHRGRTPVCHVFFLPKLEDPPVMQYMVLLEYDVKPGAQYNVARFIAYLNSNLPITGFEYSESLEHLVFRHTHAVSTAPLDPGVVAWPLTMIRYAVENYAPLLENVAEGGDLAAAVSLLAASFDQMFED
jgi:hypothetical protein